MFAAIVGVLSGLVHLAPWLDLSLPGSIALIAVAVMVASGYAWLIARPTQLPADDILLEDCATGECFVAQCVRERVPAQRVNELAAEVYPGVRPLRLDRYEQWMMVNPHLLTCLFHPDGNVVGYFDVFPFRSDFIQMLVEGLAGEQEIRREHILRPREAAKATRLYLAGIAVADRETPQGRRHASMLVWALLKYLQHYYPSPPVRQLVAQGVTPEGERLLRRFRFDLLADRRGRRDPYPLYGIMLTSEVLESALSSLPDWSRRVRLGWITPRRNLRRIRAGIGLILQI